MEFFKLIAAAVLAIMGTGTIKGFAYTLALGIVLSMFTAMVVTRTLMNIFYALGAKSEKFYGIAKEKKAVNFTSKKAVFFTISIVAILRFAVAIFAFWFFVFHLILMSRSYR